MTKHEKALRFMEDNLGQHERPMALRQPTFGVVAWGHTFYAIPCHRHGNAGGDLYWTARRCRPKENDHSCSASYVHSSLPDSLREECSHGWSSAQDVRDLRSASPRTCDSALARQGSARRVRDKRHDEQPSSVDRSQVVCRSRTPYDRCCRAITSRCRFCLRVPKISLATPRVHYA